MYNTKTILPAHASIRIKVAFELHDGTNHVEFGYSQSVNVAHNYKIMLKEAVINAFYRLNNRLGETLIKGSDSTIDIYIERKIIKDYEILNYTFAYYEDRIYSYKRVNVEGENIYLIKKNNKIIKGLPANFLKDDKLRKLEQEF